MSPFGLTTSSLVLFGFSDRNNDIELALSVNSTLLYGGPEWSKPVQMIVPLSVFISRRVRVLRVVPFGSVCWPWAAVSPSFSTRQCCFQPLMCLIWKHLLLVNLPTAQASADLSDPHIRVVRRPLVFLVLHETAALASMLIGI